MDRIVIKGAREHNLKNIDLELPRDKMIVISGVSGSGKSSLAFDTIFAEGQRRYVESLSAYARQFLGKLNKPDIDYIEGLSPSISIEQKTTARNPRSTVGTVTEIYDYYRLLFSRIGVPHCPNCGKEIKEQTIDQILPVVLSHNEGTKLMILAPVIRGKKGEHKKVLEDAASAGFVRVKIDGQIHSLEENIQLDKMTKHDIDIIVDRIILSDDARLRISEAIETSFEIADGLLKVIYIIEDKEVEEFYSTKSGCVDCGISIPELQPRLFSFNNPYGACPQCAGLGMTQEFDIDLIIPDKNLSFNEGAILTSKPEPGWQRSIFEGLAKKFNFSLDTPFKNLPKKIKDIIIYGTNEPIEYTYKSKRKNGTVEYSDVYVGILKDLNKRYYESMYPTMKSWFETFMKKSTCRSCEGKRLNPIALAVKIHGKNIHELTKMSVAESVNFFKNIKWNKFEEQVASQILKEINSRLIFLQDVGLDYLTLDRSSATLSGGEAQRIRLATQIGSQLVGVLYILDEPSIGLHQRDNEKLINTLKYLRDLGNTLIIVEHDEQTILESDYLVDLGVGAGVHGGNIIAKGTPAEVMKNPESLTGQFLSKKVVIENNRERRVGNSKFISILGATENNLKNIDVKIPLGVFNVITGVSGSGKSTLLETILYPAINNHLNRTTYDVGKCKKIEGIENIDKIVNIDQTPIGRTPRSNPATYVGFFSEIRDLFASLPESKARGYKSGRFSFNVSGGRCENCQGDGQIKIEMHFLPDVHIKCDVCNGKRYNHDTLDIRYKGKNISDVLDMTVADALKFFDKHESLYRKIKTLADVGLDYITLGQSALTLSGGEAQRVKLASQLIKKNSGNTLYIIDEPTTGLHFFDIKKLLEILQLLVDKGNTIILIEHNLDIIKQADYVIDLGPDGGDKGGEVVAVGTPEDIAKVKTSWTGKFLKKIFEEG